MKEYVKKQATYTVKPYIKTDTRTNVDEVSAFLKDTCVRVVAASQYVGAYLQYSEGATRDLFNGDVVVVSSLGEVTTMTGAQFKKEYEEA